MKKIFLIIITAISLGFLFFGIFQYYVKVYSKKGALQVTSSPVSKVYLNDKLLGETPMCKCEAEDMLKASEYTIRLVPKDSKYIEFQEKIKISKGVLTVVDRKFGHNSASSGSVISLTPLDDNKVAELLVVSIPSKAKIYLDNNQIGETPLFFKNPTVSDHTLRVAKEGYSDKTVRINTPLGFKLTVSIYLSIDSLGKASSDLVQISPTPTSIINKVLILDTPTGFLRVRVGDSISSQEIGRVLSGEVYEFVSENEGWFQIKFKDGKNGWISNQYAKKQ